ncbi:MAG: NUDIX hydrolase, partial [Deltaproteobacteria bacterium]|nr:NUDIX hydrolase [Deltaproteobacteria bacterium]
MNYCSHCGSEVSLKVPPGDDRPRYVCETCHTIHYENPKMVVGCIPEWEDRILLCRRAIEPRYGLWTIPAGFLENNETITDGARREAMEEAGVRVDIIRLYTLLDLPHVSQVYLIFRAHMRDGRFHAGEESLEVKLFGDQDIP